VNLKRDETQEGRLPKNIAEYRNNTKECR